MRNLAVKINEPTLSPYKRTVLNARAIFGGDSWKYLGFAQIKCSAGISMQAEQNCIQQKTCAFIKMTDEG